MVRVNIAQFFDEETPSGDAELAVILEIDRCQALDGSFLDTDVLNLDQDMNNRLGVDAQDGRAANVINGDRLSV